MKKQPIHNKKPKNSTATTQKINQEGIRKLKKIYETLENCPHLPKRGVILLEEAALSIQKDLIVHGVSPQELNKLKN